MRFLLTLLLSFSALSGWSLGRLTQPDGSTVALGESASDGATTLLFPAKAVPVRSWIWLPAGSVTAEAEVVVKGARRVVAFPGLTVPGLRYALEVPAQTLALTLRGQFSGTFDLVRSVTPPPRGAQLWVTRSATELRVDLPSWKVAPGWTSFLRLTRPIGSPWSVVVASGEGSRTFHFSSSLVEWDFSPAAWGLTPTTLVVQGADPRLSGVRLGAVPARDPLPADPTSLLAWPENRWRNDRREWFHWAGTSVLVLVTANYAVQDEYLKRLAFYVEKTGYRGRIVTDEEVSHLHAWNAHDYAAPDMARFYTQAAREGVSLNRSETELRETLVASGVLVESSPGVWKPGTGALVGVSAESPPPLRQVLFVHEAFHGLYFTTPEFRAGVKQAWDGLSEPAREAFRTYLSKSRYDPADEGLMVNEFQAYVLQRPQVEWEGFFRAKVLAGRPASTTVPWLVEYLAAASQLDALVTKLFGFPSGEVSRVRVSSGT